METNLKHYFDKEGFAAALILQLEKDTDVLLTNKDSIRSFNDIYEQLLPILRIKFKNNTEWMRVINRVDLSEKQIKNLSTFPGDYLEKITKAILMRVFQKVALRWASV